MAQAGKDASPDRGVVRYERHRPEATLLYQLVDEHYSAFAERMAVHGTPLPAYVQREFEDYLKCGRLEHGFLRVRCASCHAEHLVAFSCKRRGFCPSCGARRMAESAALLVDEVLPEAPMRQWVLSFPFPLRFLFASRPAIMGKVLCIVYRALAALAGRVPDPQGRVHDHHRAHRRRHLDPAFWRCAQPQRPLPYAVPRWCLCGWCRWLWCAVSLGQGADQCGTHTTVPHHRPPREPLSRASGSIGA